MFPPSGVINLMETNTNFNKNFLPCSSNVKSTSRSHVHELTRTRICNEVKDLKITQPNEEQKILAYQMRNKPLKILFQNRNKEIRGMYSKISLKTYLRQKKQQLKAL